MGRKSSLDKTTTNKLRGVSAGYQVLCSKSAYARVNDKETAIESNDVGGKSEGGGRKRDNTPRFLKGTEGILAVSWHVEKI